MYQIRKIKRQALILTLFVVFMISMSYAAVPLYKLFCQVTGYGGTPMIGSNNSYSVSVGSIDVRFDSSLEKKAPLYFEPVSKTINVKIGENSLAFYKAKNKTNKEITTMSVFNVTPLQAGKYFNKIECFCFEEQKLSPNEEVEMPVSFFIDPEIKNDKFINEISEITLSYTMFIREEE